MLEDILSEAPLYKSLVARGKEEGLKEGREEGRILSALNTLTVLFQESFPQLHALAQETLPTIKNPSILEKLIIRVARARDEQEAKKHLLEAAQQKS